MSRCGSIWNAFTTSNVDGFGRTPNRNSIEVYFQHMNETFLQRVNNGKTYYSSSAAVGGANFLITPKIRQFFLFKINYL